MVSLYNKDCNENNLKTTTTQITSPILSPEGGFNFNFKLNDGSESLKNNFFAKKCKFSDKTILYLSLLLLVVSKFVVSLSLYFLLDYFKLITKGLTFLSIDKHFPPTGLLGRLSPTLHVLAFIQFFSAIFFGIVERRSFYKNNDRLPIAQNYYKNKLKDNISKGLIILAYSAGTLLLSVLFFSSLQLSGPYPTILIARHSEITIFGIYSTLFSFQSDSNLADVKGTIFFVFGILFLFFANIFANIWKNPGSFSIFSNYSIGIILLIVYIRVTILLRPQKIASYIGMDAKRLHFISNILLGFILGFLLTIDLFSESDLYFLGPKKFYLPFITLSFILDYYTDKINFRRIDKNKVALIATSSNLISGLVFNFIWQASNHSFEYYTFFADIVAYTLIYLGVVQLSTKKSIFNIPQDNPTNFLK